MCGRFYVPDKDIDDFAGLVNDIEKELLKKAGEIYPGDYAPVITPVTNEKETEAVNDASDYNIHAIKWGFPIQKGKPVINARSETVHEKPLFKLPFAKRRCLIPARGFFEWKDAKDSKKRIKHYITLFDSEMLYFAGLYWFFKDKYGTLNPYFTILTTQANDDVKIIHDRMPVIVSDNDKKIWLYDNHESSSIQTLMKPLEQGLLKIQICD